MGDSCLDKPMDLGSLDLGIGYEETHDIFHELALGEGPSLAQIQHLINAGDHGNDQYEQHIVPNSPTPGGTVQTHPYQPIAMSPTTPENYHNNNPHAPASGVRAHVSQNCPSANLPGSGLGVSAVDGLQRSPPSFEEIYQLKDCQKMQLTISYQGIKIGEGGRHDITHNSGFTIFHKQVCPEISSSIVQFELPELKLGVAKDDDVTRLTMQVLKDMGKGLHIQYEDGFIYATRYCASRVFVWSTLNSSKTVTFKLDRGVKTIVFCYRTFIDRIYKQEADIQKEETPTVVFTFGQQWNGSSSNLKDMLVHAEVKPMKAVELLRNKSGEKRGLESMSKIMTPEDIEVSIVSPTGVYN